MHADLDQIAYLGLHQSSRKSTLIKMLKSSIML